MTATQPPGFQDRDLSAMFASADQKSGEGQRRAKLSIRVELISVILAALFGLVSLRTDVERLNWFALIAALLFVGSGLLTYVRSNAKTEQTWYIGRAGAESVKTLAWRYAVGGDPFPRSLNALEADNTYLARLARIFTELTRTTDIPPTRSGSHEITEAMRRLRGHDLADRKAIYQRDRIEDQRSWYERRGAAHGRSATTWLVITVASSALGVVFGFLKFLDVLESDLLGVFGVCASAAIAWNQLNQFRNQVSAYNVAAVELGFISDRINTVTEEAAWAAFVSDSEDAISREQIMWLARHGHPGLGGSVEDT